MSSTWSVPADATAPERHPDAPGVGDRVPEHWHGCFGCRPPSEGGLGLVARVDEGPAVTGRMTVSSDFEGGPGVIHGGILSTAFDEVMGFAAKLLSISVVTAHLETDFARPITLGSTLTVHARVDGVLRRKVYISAAARLDGAAEPVGTARGLFIRIDEADHFRELAGNSDRI